MEGKVLLQLRGLSEGLETVVTAVRPLTGVCQDVGLEVGGVQEALTAVVAAVGSLQSVHTVMGLKGTAGGEGLATLVTLIGPQVVLLPQVSDVVTLELDDFTTLVTPVALRSNLIWGRK